MHLQTKIKNDQSILFPVIADQRVPRGGWPEKPPPPPPPPPPPIKKTSFISFFTFINFM